MRLCSLCVVVFVFLVVVCDCFCDRDFPIVVGVDFVVGFVIAFCFCS